MNKTLITSLAFLLCLASCTTKTATDKPNDSNATDKQQASAAKRNIVKKHISIPREFTHITNIGSVDIIFSHGDYSMEVEGDSGLIEYITTDFDCNLLTVSLKSDANPDYNIYGNDNSVKLHISAPTIKCINICGIGGFECTDKILEDDLQIGMLGTGNVKLKDVESKTFLIESTGSGNISIEHLKAETATLNSRNEGSFTIDCDVNDFTIINAGEQKISLTGTIHTKTIYNKEDKNLQDSTK